MAQPEQKFCRGDPGEKVLQSAGKPNPVPAIPCGLRRGDDHSSSPAITRRVQQPTRWLRTGRPKTPPYLVLLRAGFCLPPTLPPARCALTAPFHPYPSTQCSRTSLGAVFFLCHYPSSCPARALPGALPFGVRTFLPPTPFGLWHDKLESLPRRSTRYDGRRSSSRLRQFDYRVLSLVSGLWSLVSGLRSSVSRYIWSIDLDAAVPVPWGDDRPGSTNSK